MIRFAAIQPLLDNGPVYNAGIELTSAKSFGARRGFTRFEHDPSIPLLGFFHELQHYSKSIFVLGGVRVESEEFASQVILSNSVEWLVDIGLLGGVPKRLGLIWWWAKSFLVSMLTSFETNHKARKGLSTIPRSQRGLQSLPYHLDACTSPAVD